MTVSRSLMDNKGRGQSVVVILGRGIRLWMLNFWPIITMMMMMMDEYFLLSLTHPKRVERILGLPVVQYYFDDLLMLKLKSSQFK